jgi:hypothetical protein
VPQKAPAAPLWKARGSARKIFDNLEETLRRFPIQAGIIVMAYFGASTWACDGLSHKFPRRRQSPGKAAMDARGCLGLERRTSPRLRS